VDCKGYRFIVTDVLEVVPVLPPKTRHDDDVACAIKSIGLLGDTSKYEEVAKRLVL
jgi:hypothetical protein